MGVSESYSMPTGRVHSVAVEMSAMTAKKVEERPSVISVRAVPIRAL